MPVNFNEIPQNLRRPLFWIELDPSRAGNLVLDRSQLMIGTGLTTQYQNSFQLIGSGDQAGALWDPGSQLAAMVRAAKGANNFDEMFAVNVPEPVAGNQAVGTIVAASAPSAAGTLHLYVAGTHLQAAIAASDGVNDVATKIADAINAVVELPVTASATTDTVTITCRWKGITGNEIDIRVNYRGLNGGEELPTGLGLTITPMAGGTGNVDLTAAITSMADNPFENCATAFNADAPMDQLRDEFAFGDVGRWGWQRQLYGHVYAAKDGTAAELATYGNGRNEGSAGVWGLAGSPTPQWERAAIWAAVHHRSLLNDPARPLHTLVLPGVLAPEVKDQFSNSVQNSLLYDGVSVSESQRDGTVRILKSITCYQQNAFGSPDDALLKTNTMATSSYVHRSLRQRIESTFPRHKLANDGTRFGPGQAIVAPNIARAEMVAHYAELEFLGLVENAKEFKRNLIVERDTLNPNRLNTLYPPDYINQLDVFAVVNQFRLQYPAFRPGEAVPAV